MYKNFIIQILSKKIKKDYQKKLTKDIKISLKKTNKNLVSIEKNNC